jgi:hypothetical protein
LKILVVKRIGTGLLQHCPTSRGIDEKDVRYFRPWLSILITF